MIVRKAQEKKETERFADNGADERDDEVLERGVIDAVDETRFEDREVDAKEKSEDVQVLTKSVKSMSL